MESDAPRTPAVLKAVCRRLVPNLVEATLVPAVLFAAAYAAWGVTAAFAVALVWSSIAVARRLLSKEPVPAIVLLAGVGITLRTLIAIGSRSSFVYFVQPVLARVVVSAMFLGSVIVGRPLIARFAGDFVTLDPDVASRPGIVQLYRRLTFLWAVINLAAAAVTFALLTALPVGAFVTIRPLIGWALTVPGIVLTVLASVRVARGEGLLVSVAPGGGLIARPRDSSACVSESLTAAAPASMGVPAPAPRPYGRGVLHALAAVTMVPAGVLLLIRADGSAATAVAAIYASALFLMFATSASYHCLARSTRSRRVMQRLDHCGIYLLIAGTYVPICMLALPLAWGIPILSVVGVVSAMGIAMKLGSFQRSQTLGHVLYLALGWGVVIAGPMLLRNLTGTQMVLLVAGGLVYTVGFPVLVTNRPNPWPKAFGYHEVWHSCTVAAAGLHFALVAGLTH